MKNKTHREAFRIRLSAEAKLLIAILVGLKLISLIEQHFQ